MNIILSIKPKWAELIYSGKKKIEWRKNLPRNSEIMNLTELRDGTDKVKVYLYETAPVKKVTGFFYWGGVGVIDVRKLEEDADGCGFDPRQPHKPEGYSMNSNIKPSKLINNEAYYTFGQAVQLLPFSGRTLCREIARGKSIAEKIEKRLNSRFCHCCFFGHVEGEILGEPLCKECAKNLYGFDADEECPVVKKIDPYYQLRYRRQKALPIFEAYLHSELERFKLELKLENKEGKVDDSTL